MKLNLHKLHSYICPDEAEYYASQPDFKTAWQNCVRADWMLYIIRRLNISSQKTTLCANRITETVLRLMDDYYSVAAAKETSAITFIGSAAYTADAAVYVASVYATTAAYTVFLKTSSDICREILTEEVFAAIDKLENNN